MRRVAAQTRRLVLLAPSSRSILGLLFPVVDFAAAGGGVLGLGAGLTFWVWGLTAGVGGGHFGFFWFGGLGVGVA